MYRAVMTEAGYTNRILEFESSAMEFMFQELHHYDDVVNPILKENIKLLQMIAVGAGKNPPKISDKFERNFTENS